MPVTEYIATIEANISDDSLAKAYCFALDSNLSDAVVLTKIQSGEWATHANFQFMGPDIPNTNQSVKTSASLRNYFSSDMNSTDTFLFDVDVDYYVYVYAIDEHFNDIVKSYTLNPINFLDLRYNVVVTFDDYLFGLSNEYIQARPVPNDPTIHYNNNDDMFGYVSNKADWNTSLYMSANVDPNDSIVTELYVIAFEENYGNIVDKVVETDMIQLATQYSNHTQIPLDTTSHGFVVFQNETVSKEVSTFFSTANVDTTELKPMAIGTDYFVYSCIYDNSFDRYIIQFENKVKAGFYPLIEDVYANGYVRT